MKKGLLVLVITIISFKGFSQDNSDGDQKSNVQTYTPSKLLSKGQWDIKFFNGLYTQTKQTNGKSESTDIPRQSFLTNTTEVYTGLSDNSRINIGFIFQVRSNTLTGQKATDVFKFQDNSQARSGITAVAPSVRIQPFESLSNFSLTSSLYLPIFEDKANAPYLDKRSTFWETKFFYDKTFGDNKWQAFYEVDLGFNFGEKRKDADPVNTNIGERFANNSIFLPISAFLSYFPSEKSTVFINTQQAFLIGYDNPGSDDNTFSQNSTALGFGGKYQLTDALNLEASFNKIVRGHNFQGLGSTFSIGLRALL